MSRINSVKSLQTFRRLLTAGFLAAGLLVTGISIAPPLSQAQETLRIAAVVNDDIISVFDLNSRTLLVIVLSRLPRTQRSVEGLMPQVLRMLIDEKLKLQEAERLGITVSQQELESALLRVEKINKFAPGKLFETLESMGIGVDTLVAQAQAEIAWSRIVPRQYGNNVAISEQDIDVAQARAAERRNQPRYLMSEIVLPFDNPTKNLEVQKQAQQLIQELKNGARFDSLARAFSQAPSATNGGALDWMRLDQMPDSVSRIVQTMGPGQISTEILLPAAYIIVNLQEVQAGGVEKKADVIVELNQFHLGLPGDATPSAVESYMQTARDKTRGATSCKSFSDAAKQSGSPLSGSLGRIALAKLPDHLSSTIEDLKTNTPSQPIRTEDAIIVLMVCERIEPRTSPDAAEKDRIRQRLFEQRIAVYARQAMRDLLRAAYIDIR